MNLLRQPDTSECGIAEHNEDSFSRRTGRLRCSEAAGWTCCSGQSVP